MTNLGDPGLGKMAGRFNSASPWIQLQHLQEDILLSYRNSFEAHPARLIVLKHFLQTAVAEQLSRFLRTEAKFHPEYGLYSVKNESVSEREWLKADDEDRFFRLSKLIGSCPDQKFTPTMLTYLRFRKAFQDPGVRGFFEELCGMVLGWSDDFGAHSMKAGDFLKPHTDDNRNRRLALVIYLSEGWAPRFGGALNVVDSRGQKTKIEAEYNSMIVFDVDAGASHFVDPILPEAKDRVRLTIGGWYHKPK